MGESLGEGLVVSIVELDHFLGHRHQRQTNFLGTFAQVYCTFSSSSSSHLPVLGFPVVVELVL